MKAVTAISLIVLYTLGTLRPLVPYLEYEINKGYIAEFLCINKDQPAEMTVCYGKCYLTKKLKEAQPSEGNPQNIPIKIQDYPIGFVHHLEVDLQRITQSPSLNVDYKNLYYFLEEKSIDHPPASFIS